MFDRFVHVAVVLPSPDDALMAALLVATGASQFVRRITWRVRWEASTTATGLLMCMALLLLSPHMVAALPWVPDVMEESHFYPHVVAGHILLATSFALFLYDLAGRMDWTAEQKHRFVTLRITAPATVLLPTLIGAYVTSQEQYVYPVVYLTYLWTLAHIAWLLNIVRITDRRTPQIVHTYLGAVAFAAAAIHARFFTEMTITSCWGWRLATIGAILLMIGSTVSWVRKYRFIKGHMWSRIGKEKRLKRKPFKATPEPLLEAN
jgi:hypothetical protein